MAQAPKHHSPWRALSTVPAPLATSRYVMEPLEEKHAEADFAAIMSCRIRLREELGWGKWPPEDFTLELNRADLRGHQGEFTRGEAFAYTVLSPDCERCLGCIYLERSEEIDGAQLTYWLVEELFDIEARFVAEILQWVHRAWSIDRVLIPLRESNTRGIAVARQCGLAAIDNVRSDFLSNHRCFLSTSPKGPATAFEKPAPGHG